MKGLGHRYSSGDEFADPIPPDSVFSKILLNFLQTCLHPMFYMGRDSVFSKILLNFLQTPTRRRRASVILVPFQGIKKTFHKGRPYLCGAEGTRTLDFFRDREAL